MRAPIRVGYEELAKTFPGFGDTDNIINPPLIPRRRYGQVDFNELAIISAIISIRNPSVIFEFGRFDGLTTLCLAQSAPNAQIYTLDLPDGVIDTKLPSDRAEYAKDAPKIARQRWKSYGVYDQITEILIDSASFKPADHFNGALIGKVGFIFIDANHNYEYVLIDTKSSNRMLSPDGMLMWHDYFKRSFPGVTAYLAELSERDKICWIENPDPPDYLETSLCYHIEGQRKST